MAGFKICYARCGLLFLQALAVTCFLLLCFAPPPVTSFSQGVQIQANFRIYCNRRASQRFPVHYDVATCNGLCEARRNAQNLLNIKVNASSYFRVGVEVLIEVDPTRGRNLNILGFAVIAVTDDDRIVGRFAEHRDVLIASCDPLLEGSTAFHARSVSRRSSLKLVWQPGTRNYGRVHFRAWIVARHSEIYVLDSDYIHNEITGSKTIPVKDDFYLIMLKVLNISRSDIILSPPASVTADNTVSTTPHTLTIGSSGSGGPAGVERVHVVSNSTADDRGDENVATTLVVSFAGGRRAELRIPTLDSFESSFQRRLMTGFDLEARDPFAHTKRDVPEFIDMFPEAPSPSLDSPLSAPFAPDPTNPFLQSFSSSGSLTGNANPFQTSDRLQAGNGPTSFSIIGQTPNEITALRFGQQGNRNSPGLGAFPANANPFASQDFGSRLNSNSLSSSAAQLPFFPSSTSSFSVSSSGQLGFPDLQTMLSRQVVAPSFGQQQGLNPNGGRNQFTPGPLGQQQAVSQNGFLAQQQSLGFPWFGQQGVGQQPFSFPSQQSLGGAFGAQQSAGQQPSTFGQFSANPFSLFDFQQQSSNTFPTSSGLGFPNFFSSNNGPLGGTANAPVSSLSNVGQGQFGSFFGGSSGGSSSFGSLPFTSNVGASSFLGVGQNQASSFFGASPVTNFGSSPFASGFASSGTSFG